MAPGAGSAGICVGSWPCRARRSGLPRPRARLGGASRRGATGHGARFDTARVSTRRSLPRAVRFHTPCAFGRRRVQASVHGRPL